MKAQVKPAIATLLSEKTRNLTYALYVFLIIGLVLHAPLVTFFEANVSAGPVLRAWKEIVATVVLLALLPRFFKQKLYKDRLVRFVALYGLFSLLITALVSDALSLPAIAGFRVNIFPFALLIIGRLLPLKEKKLQDLLIISGLIVAGAMFVQYLLPSLFNFSVLADNAEHITTLKGSNVRRLYGTIYGPLQSSSFLILSLAASVFSTRRPLSKVFLASVFILGVLSTQSRAAMIAVAVVLIVKLYISHKIFFTTGRIAIVAGASFVALSVFVFASLSYAPLSSLVFHAKPEDALKKSSTIDHVRYPILGVKSMIEKPLGQGLGAVGPASYFSGTVVPIENNFIQIGVEVGFLGLLLFIACWCLLAKELYLVKSNWLLAAMAGLSLMAMLLHTLTDTATIWVFLLACGAALGVYPNNIENAERKVTSN